MFFPTHLRRCGFAAFLQCFTLLRFGALARPFVLLSGVDVLPDDDLKPVTRPRFHISRLSADTARRTTPLRRLTPPAMTLISSRPEPVQEFASTYSGIAAASAQPAKCRDVRQDILVESGLQGHADVFSGGHTTAQWDPMSASSSNSAFFVLPPAEQVAVFVVHTGQAAVLQQPQVAVADPSILSVELAEEESKGGRARRAGIRSGSDPVVLLSKHVCKKSGVTTVAIELPFQRSRATTSSGLLCPGKLAPVIFSYQKECSTPPSVALAQSFWPFHMPAKDNKRLALSSQTPQVKKPWEGIIPSGGARIIFLVFLVLATVVVLYEFGMHWMSRKIEEALLQLGPVMFGCRITIDHVSLSMQPKRLVYTLQGMQFANPEGGEYSKEFFMNIEEVKVRINTWKLFTTCGRVIEIRELRIHHITANIEKDGVFFGNSNISKVLAQMEKNNKQWLADLASMKENHGIDAAKLWGDIEAWMQKVGNRVSLQEVFIEGINYSVSNRAFGMEMSIADMEYHDFSHQHNAVGMQAIGYYLTHAVLQGMAEDIAGVELGHGRFEGLVDTLKGFAGAKTPPKHPADV